MSAEFKDLDRQYNESDEDYFRRIKFLKSKLDISTRIWSPTQYKDNEILEKLRPIVSIHEERDALQTAVHPPTKPSQKKNGHSKI